MISLNALHFDVWPTLEILFDMLWCGRLWQWDEQSRNNDIDDNRVRAARNIKIESQAKEAMDFGIRSECVLYFSQFIRQWYLKIHNTEHTNCARMKNEMRALRLPQSIKWLNGHLCVDGMTRKKNAEPRVELPWWFLSIFTHVQRIYSSVRVCSCSVMGCSSVVCPTLAPALECGFRTICCFYITIFERS